MDYKQQERVFSMLFKVTQARLPGGGTLALTVCKQEPL